MSLISGYHHVTMSTDSAQESHDFFTADSNLNSIGLEIIPPVKSEPHSCFPLKRASFNQGACLVIGHAKNCSNWQTALVSFASCRGGVNGADRPHEVNDTEIAVLNHMLVLLSTNKPVWQGA